MLSQRGAASAGLFPSYFDTVREKTAQAWAPERPCEGYVLLCIAENRLTEDLLAARLREARIPAQHISGYPPGRGLPSLTTALARYCSRTFLKGLAVDPKHLTALAGCGAVLDQLFFAIANPGDAVLIPAPYYPAFDSDLALRNGLRPTPVHLAPGAEWGPQLDAAAAAAEAAGHPVAALLLTNPNNPDGALLPRGALEACLRWALQRGVHLVSDEIYANSTFTPSEFHSMLGIVAGLPSEDLRRAARQQVHMIFGLSKDWCANGLRVGCLHTENAALLECLEGLSYFAGISSIAQEVIAGLLEDAPFVERFLAANVARLQEAYTVITDALRQAEIPFTPAGGAMFVWADLGAALPEPTWEAEAAFWRQLVEEARVILTPGRTCHAPRPGFFRICYAAAPLGGLVEGIARLHAFLARTRDVPGARLAPEGPPQGPLPLLDPVKQDLQVAGC